ncbi:MAG: RNA polymerase sigma factor, partial [Vicinamibacterales bacterium]
VLDMRRSTRRQEALLSMFGNHLAPAPVPEPQVDGDQLARCVQSLRQRERSVIVMAFYDEQSAGETARLLGTSEANIRVIRHRAIRQLRSCMETPR